MERSGRVECLTTGTLAAAATAPTSASFRMLLSAAADFFFPSTSPVSSAILASNVCFSSDCTSPLSSESFSPKLESWFSWKVQ